MPFEKDRKKEKKKKRSFERTKEEERDATGRPTRPRVRRRAARAAPPHLELGLLGREPRVRVGDVGDDLALLARELVELARERRVLGLERAQQVELLQQDEQPQLGRLETQTNASERAPSAERRASERRGDEGKEGRTKRNGMAQQRVSVERQV